METTMYGIGHRECMKITLYFKAIYVIIIATCVRIHSFMH